MQSLLEIYLYFILNDFWEDSEPANLEPHIFFLNIIAWNAEFLQRSTSQPTKGREGKLLVP